MANTAGPQASVGNGQTMNADAAKYYNALVREVRAATGVAPVATEGTRTYARQKYLYDNRNKPGFNPAWHPDDRRAYHLSGRAVDVGSGVGYVNTAVSKDFYGRAPAFGFRATVQGEPWHFEWQSAWVRPDIRQRVDTARPAETKPPTPIPEEEDDSMKSMFIIQTKASTAPNVIDYWLVNGATFEYIHLANQTQIDFWLKLGAKNIEGPQPSAVLSGFTPKGGSGGVR